MPVKQCKGNVKVGGNMISVHSRPNFSWVRHSFVPIFHSLRKLFTGFIKAAFTL